LFLAKHISRIALIPKKYLMPVVAVLAITGASIGYGHIYYLWISIIFGFLGYIMKKGGFPVIATGMALILGPLIERNLRAALMLPETRMMIFFSRPISLFFILLSIVIVVFAIFKKKPDNY